MCVFSYFLFGFEGRICDLIVSVPDHCLSFYSRYLDDLLNIGNPYFGQSNLSTLIAVKQS